MVLALTLTAGATVALFFFSTSLLQLRASRWSPPLVKRDDHAGIEDLLARQQQERHHALSWPVRRRAWRCSRSISSCTATRNSASTTLFGFHAVYGFVACVVLVLAAKQLRRVLMRDENYYER